MMHDFRSWRRASSMILETRHLRLVSVVVEHGTLTKAGRVLHMTQSGLSRQLLDLETRLGLPLFHRLGKRMVPTPAGECLLVAARRTLPQLSDVEEDLRRLAGGRTAILRVSTECYTCYHWLPGVLQRFARRFPRVDVQIVAEATHHPVPALLDGRIDLALVKGGAGIAVLARWAVAPHLKTGELTALPLTRRGLERRWRAAMLRQRPLPLHLREFAGLLAAGPSLLSRRQA